MSKNKRVETLATQTESAAPPAQPQLTAEQKIRLLTLQRTALLAESQRKAADQQFEKAMQELTAAYQQAMQQHPGHALNEVTLEFQPAEKQQ